MNKKHTNINTQTCFKHQSQKCSSQILLVSIPKSTKLLLTSSIPAVKSNLSTVGEKIKRMDLHTDGCCSQRCTKISPCQNITQLSLPLQANHILSQILRSYFFSNSPVRCLFTKVVFPAIIPNMYSNQYNNNNMNQATIYMVQAEINKNAYADS